MSFPCIFRIGVDEWLRVPSVQDVFSVGDCSGFLESTGKPVLPALAQVKLNNIYRHDVGMSGKPRGIMPYSNLMYVHDHIGTLVAIPATKYVPPPHHYSLS